MNIPYISDTTQLDRFGIRSYKQSHNILFQHNRYDICAMKNLTNMI